MESDTHNSVSVCVLLYASMHSVAGTQLCYMSVYIGYGTSSPSSSSSTPATASTHHHQRAKQHNHHHHPPTASINKVCAKIRQTGGKRLKMGIRENGTKIPCSWDVMCCDEMRMWLRPPTRMSIGVDGLSGVSRSNTCQHTYIYILYSRNAHVFLNQHSRLHTFLVSFPN